jgi:predicted DNA-binding transcriptional regulator AlpA
MTTTETEASTLPEVATRAQVAEYMQISVSTLARWAMEPGKGPKITKLGSNARYLRADVLAYLAANGAQ